MRIAHNELIYTAEEFKELSCSSICRKYNIGSDWVDMERDENAAYEVTHVSTR